MVQITLVLFCSTNSDLYQVYEELSTFTIRVFQKIPKLEFDPIELGAVKGWYEDPPKKFVKLPCHITGRSNAMQLKAGHTTHATNKEMQQLSYHG